MIETLILANSFEKYKTLHAFHDNKVQTLQPSSYYVYSVRNEITRKLYVGIRSSTRNEQLMNYLGSGVAIQRSVSKYGKEHFSKVILCICSNIEQCRVIEANIVDLDFLRYNDGKDTYNRKAGGERSWGAMPGAKNPFFGKKHSLESRRKISNSLKGRKISDSWRINMSNSQKGRALPETQKENMSKAASIRNRNSLWLKRTDEYGIHTNHLVFKSKLDELLAKGYVLGKLTKIEKTENERNLRAIRSN